MIKIQLPRYLFHSVLSPRPRNIYLGNGRTATSLRAYSIFSTARHFLRKPDKILFAVIVSMEVSGGRKDLRLDPRLFFILTTSSPFLHPDCGLPLDQSYFSSFIGMPRVDRS